MSPRGGKKTAEEMRTVLECACVSEIEYNGLAIPKLVYEGEKCQ